MSQSNHCCLAVLGRERPGIVAAITGILLDLDCNIRDSSMMILAGEFSMLLIVELPDGLLSDQLEPAFNETKRRFDLVVLCKPLNANEIYFTPPPGSHQWAITIYGGDRKGIVHHVASLMARKGISITEVKSKVIGPTEGAGVAMMKVLAPAQIDLATIREHLNDLALQFGVEVSVG